MMQAFPVIVEMMREAGATEVHFRVASPPTAHSASAAHPSSAEQEERRDCCIGAKRVKKARSAKTASLKRFEEDFKKSILRETIKKEIQFTLNHD